MTLVACTGCRGQKTACDGQRPACGRCRKRRSGCIYPKSRLGALKQENDTLKAISKANDDLLQFLKEAPIETAWATLQELRLSSDPSKVLQRLAQGSSYSNVSEQEAARAILPPLDSQVELELIVKHPEAYPSIEILDNRVLPRSLHLSSLSELDTLLQLSVPLLPRRASSTVATSNASTIEAHCPTPGGLVPATQMGPHPSPYYHDVRLAYLDVAYWTTVPISNHCAADAISMYLEITHPFMGLFDADLFLDNLVNKKFSYCSPFFVSS
ncbi:hypothetical protein BJ170DRAFT_642885 [Xylariales sp. AK1849]|nr:hypothetical protein BJ170DRAFT_642885 [Xylariales sp. AK1849]